MPRRAAKRDANESHLLALARTAGAYVIRMHEDQGFDVLLLHRARVLIVEIKDEKKRPSSRKLTDNEANLQDICKSRKVPYYVVQSEQELLRLLNEK